MFLVVVFFCQVFDFGHADARGVQIPGDAKCVTEILGDKNKELGGTTFKFGQLILRKIIKIVTTRCHILRLKCTKFTALTKTP